MQTCADVIAESFHSEVEVTWKLKSTTHAIAAFNVKSIAVEVDFERREQRGPWHVGSNTVHGELADRTNMTLAFPIFNGVFQVLPAPGEKPHGRNWLQTGRTRPS